MADLIEQGAAAFRAGDKAGARALLAQAIKQAPDSERAWGWMYNVAETDDERVHCLKEVVRINPQNVKANDALNRLTGFVRPTETIATTTIPADQVTSTVQALQKCPYCAEMVLADAVVCKYCGREISPNALRAAEIRDKAKMMNAGASALGNCSCALGLLGLAILFVPIIFFIWPFLFTGK